MKLGWIDTRGLGDLARSIAEEVVHVGLAGIVTDDAEQLRALPPTITRVAVTLDQVPSDELVDAADVVLVSTKQAQEARGAALGDKLGVYVDVDNQPSLDEACRWASTASWTVIDFKDPTKIPLEIVLAAADNAEGRVVTVVHDLQEAAIVLGVLEKGSDGVLLATNSVGQATELSQLCHQQPGRLKLEELEVVHTAHVGLGDRVCVDTCSHFGKDEGILVGSYASGMILSCSETHPLPYMPTRPFRVNAGALHSYTIGPGNRTRYLSELESGAELLAVTADGRTRHVVVGRAKIETRPLLEISARAPSGAKVDLIVQDDWHVRVLGPGASVLNVTDLKPGDRVLGAVFDEPRHVGYAVREFLLEK